MDSVLLDTGPLVALFKIDDKQNQAVKDWLRSNRVKLLKTHAVITEACYLLNYDSDRPVAMLTWLARGMSLRGDIRRDRRGPAGLQVA